MGTELEQRNLRYFLEHRGVNAEEPFGILPANNNTCIQAEKDTRN